MARDFLGNRKITKEDKYTKNQLSFNQTDEYIEYFKMTLMVIGALVYLYYIFK